MGSHGSLLKGWNESHYMLMSFFDSFELIRLIELIGSFTQYKLVLARTFNEGP